MDNNNQTNTSLLLTQALHEFGLDTGDPEFIRHNENLTYRVRSSEGDYLLRIHRHKDGFTDGDSYDGLDRAALYETELKFLNFLRSRGMTLQIPKESIHGNYVVSLDDGTRASCLGWIEGHIIDKKELSVELCHEIGFMCACMHEFSRDFPVVTALHYDSTLCCKLSHNLRGFICEGGLDCDMMIASALSFIGERLKTAESDFILVHSDMSLSNIIITEHGVVPIDFSLFGYSHPMMDIAGLFCNIDGTDLRNAILNGYEAGGGIVNRDILDCCFALDILLSINLHKSLWINEDWFIKRLSVWCTKFFQPLSLGERIC